MHVYLGTTLFIHDEKYIKVHFSNYFGKTFLLDLENGILYYDWMQGDIVSTSSLKKSEKYTKQSLSKSLIPVLAISTMLVGGPLLLTVSPTAEYFVEMPIRIVETHILKRDTIKNEIKENLVRFEHLFPLIDFEPIYQELEATAIVYDPFQREEYSKEKKTINVSSKADSLSISNAHALWIGELTLDFFVQNYRPLQEQFDETSEVQGIKKLCAIYWCYPDRYKASVLTEHFDMEKLFLSYVFGNQTELGRLLSQTGFEEESYSILRNLDMITRLDSMEGYHFFDQIYEKNQFITKEIPSNDIYYQEVIELFQNKLEKKLGPLHIRMDNFEKRVKTLRIYLFQDERYNRNKITHTSGRAFEKENKILLSDLLYQQNYDIVFHELTHIASFSTHFETKIGPFEQNQEFMESWNTLITNWLFLEEENVLDHHYGYVYGPAYLLYFLGDPYLLTQSFFENDEVLFKKAFDQEILSEEDMYFVLDIFYNQEIYTKSDLQKCYSILLDSYTKRVIQLVEEGKDHAPLGVYASFFDRCIQYLEISHNTVLDQENTKAILEQAIGRKIETVLLKNGNYITGEDLSFFYQLIDPYERLISPPSKVLKKF